MSTDEELLTAHRNTAGLISHAEGYFTAAHDQGLMALYAQPRPGREVDIVFDGFDAKRVTDFVRCSYLGLDNHPMVVDGAIEALREYRALHWSCARTRLNFAILRDLELTLADLFQARIITYTTVLAANMGALPIVASGHLTGGVRPLMAFDRHAHATLAFHKGTIALETQVRTIGHNDLNMLEDLCKTNKSVAYICDGVYSMGGNAPMHDLLSLQDRYGLFLYIDDAHGISIWGKQGEGFARSHFGSDLGPRTIIAASLGKGFGASGGMLMLGTARQEELFRRFAVAHAFSASLNVASIGAALGSTAIHRSGELAERQSALRSNIELLDSLLRSKQAGAPLPIRTVDLGSEERAVAVTRGLLDRGIYGSAIFFPTVAKGRAGIRVCVTADHTTEQVHDLCAALSDALDFQSEG
ncbi:aminotransferase class I/II-fold pyridoxal phosphate-dependent enzyme [Agrobacterium rosae]|uniref:8-amino-7-oxononanoate synthase family protein n=1 Tax=Agrobacterium rosae TaxID=1972867 RepID=UPI000CD9E9FD|nr:aminotransferase class I/II-fold pyridoxal phosphate-dependent enzyme [Agrobacterium rosae]POO49801.1 7-keto-8-aminopelargonate synthetase [Agrobacterium rosae]